MTIAELKVADLEGAKKTMIEHGYEYISPLGRGAMASVHLVRSVQYEEKFVIKIQHIKQEISPENEAEIRTLMGLNHPNIIKIYRFFTDATFLYIGLEYCPSGSLGAIVEKSGPISGQMLIYYAREMLEGLKFCHTRDITHRDIKPDNILIDRYGRPKLADFGISTNWMKDMKMRWYGGSQAYMAPEVFVGRPYNPYKADIFSLSTS